MDRTQLAALAEIYMDRANSAPDDASSNVWALASYELRAASKGVDVVAEHMAAQGFEIVCPYCEQGGKQPHLRKCPEAQRAARKLSL